MEIKILKKENLRVQGSSLETEEIALVDKLKKKISNLDMQPGEVNLHYKIFVRSTYFFK